MGSDKTFALLGDRPVIAHTIAAFEAAGSVDAVIVVARNERVSELRQLVSDSAYRKVSCVIPGGMHRQDSVSEGLRNLSASAEYVAVHDAARPLITPAQITRVFEAACWHGAAALAAPVTDTLKSVDAEGFVSGSIAREGVYAMQTPQIFRRALLLDAYRQVSAQRLTITDEVSALQHCGQRVVVVANEEPNLKITFPADLALAAFVQSQRQAGN